jgi:hypothetical protein
MLEIIFRRWEFVHFFFNKLNGSFSHSGFIVASVKVRQRIDHNTFRHFLKNLFLEKFGDFLKISYQNLSGLGYHVSTKKEVFLNL